MPSPGQIILRTAFVSTSVGPMGDDALARLVASSRARNERLGISSVLMLFEGSFMHAMEGEPRPISELLERVRQDPRHHSIYMLIEEVDNCRQLPPWPLAGGPHVEKLSSHWIPGQDGGTHGVDVDLLGSPCLRVFAAMQRRP